MLNDTDDPQGWSQRIATEWRVTEKIRLGRRLANGSSVCSSHVVFTAGDYVDIAALVDISYRGNKGVSVQFSMTEVVQLTSASDVAVSLSVFQL